MAWAPHQILSAHGPPGKSQDVAAKNVLILPISTRLRTQLVFRVGAARFFPSGSHQLDEKYPLRWYPKKKLLTWTTHRFPGWSGDDPDAGPGYISWIPSLMSYELVPIVGLHLCTPNGGEAFPRSWGNAAASRWWLPAQLTDQTVSFCGRAGPIGPLPAQLGYELGANGRWLAKVAMGKENV